MKKKKEVTDTPVNRPIIGMKTVPSGCKNPVLAGAFVGLVRFALTKPEFVMAFEEHSRKKFLPPLTPEFADWVNINLWGET